MLYGACRKKVSRATVITLLYLVSVGVIVDKICRGSGLRQVSNGTAVRRIYTYFNYAIIECQK